MVQGHTAAKDVIVLVGQHNGVTVIPAHTSLTRLNYFDGKFLRAADLQAEQEYLRNLVFLSNQAGGSGVAHGYDVVRGTGDSLTIGPGLAVDPMGRVLVLTQDVVVSVTDLIKQSTVLSNATGLKKTPGLMLRKPEAFQDCEIVRETGTATPLPVRDLYLITIGHAEGLCGQEDVYGKLCEEACITSKDRPYRVEGVVIRAVPLALRTPLAKSGAVPLTKAHFRSLVAGAYYEDERQRIADLISGPGLRSDAWCLGADAEAGQTLPIAVVSFDGTSLVFLDSWIARRERIDAPAKRYWQWRMAMRPWDVYLAQILQFQCQLHNLFETASDSGSTDDPCQKEQALIREAADTVEALAGFYKKVSGDLKLTAAVFGRPEMNIWRGNGGLTKVDDLQKRLLSARKVFDLAATQRRLIRGGIIELPSAGYLPVVPGITSVNQQVRALLGEGVDLRFCVVRPDYVAHALEEAQHMERISLLQGLDNPRNKPEVDILVPNGEIARDEQRLAGTGFEGRVSLLTTPAEQTKAAMLHKASVVLTGAGRSVKLETGGGAFHFAGATEAKKATIASLGAELRHVGTLTATHVNKLEELAKSSEAISVSGSSIRTDPQFMTTMIAAASRASRYRASLLAAGGKEAEVPPFEEKIATETRLAAFWITMQCDRNPFEMEAHDTTPVTLRTILEMPGGDGVELNVRLQGEFRVDQSSAIGSDRRKVSGRLSLFGGLKGSGTDSNDFEKTSPLEIDAVLELTSRSAQNLLLDITLTYLPRAVFKIATEWSHGPILSKTAVTYSVGNSSVELLRGDMKENTEVLQPAHAMHTLALSALQVIGAALKDTGFAANASKQLFPPAEPAREEVSVKGTLDWVLFHRRRNKQCAIPEETPRAVVRRYQVYHASAKDNKQLDALRTALLTGDVTKRVELSIEAAMQIEFGAGVATLLSSQDAVLDDWKRVDPGNQLVYAAIASTDPGDGDTLATQRLGNLEAAVAPVTVLAPEIQQPNEVIPKVPESLTVAGTDGIIVLATDTRVSKLTVYAVKSEAKFKDEIEKGEREGVVPETIFANEGIGKVLGDVEFKAGKGEIADQESLQNVKTAWTRSSSTPGAPGAAGLVFRAAESQQKGVYIEQARFVLEELGGADTVQALEVKQSPVELPGNRNAILFLIPRRITIRKTLIVEAMVLDQSRHRILKEDARKAKIVEFENNALKVDQWKELLPNMRNQLLGIALATLDDQVDSDAKSRVKAAFTFLVQAKKMTTSIEPTVGVISDADKNNIKNNMTDVGIAITDIDEVMFLEFKG